MAKLSRILIPNTPHHITQRGNRRQQTFFSDDDYTFYLRILDETCKGFGVGIDAYCLMPNHVHLILTPQDEEGIRAALVETHSAYTRRINMKKKWKGYLWQGRFFSCPMDERYFHAAVDYVENNPVRAMLCNVAEDYPWSSAKARSLGIEDRWVLLSERNLRKDNGIESSAFYQHMRHHTKTGRPFGTEEFLALLERKYGRPFAVQKSGPKPKVADRSSG